MWRAALGGRGVPFAVRVSRQIYAETRTLLLTLMEPISTTSLVTIIFIVFMVGYVLGVAHGADEERRNHERHGKG